VNDWIMPLVPGAGFYVLGALRSGVILGGPPLNKFTCELRNYGTVGVIGEGHLILILRSLLQGTSFYADVAGWVILASVLWWGLLVLVAVRRNRGDNVSSS
jgi:hypothetical protein